MYRAPYLLTIRPAAGDLYAAQGCSHRYFNSYADAMNVVSILQLNGHRFTYDIINLKNSPYHYGN